MIATTGKFNGKLKIRKENAEQWRNETMILETLPYSFILHIKASNIYSNAYVYKFVK